ncbi:Chloride channel core [Pseudodesulfovibrio profundus]|uniref:Chloride channel core n=1 Tax=Pseudodesulfovibrio profundus TaxID=57320 RepID=A0A2C8FDS9_9BACT|nr:chloride channel protein [Pseudodesulfovibrio profundus]MBC17149.1 chloride channel protein [Desulfovibrio sp.]SOB60583.1 Chloride channel core [Pseudodesulfovibrio profundus]|tara:strand:+ start:1372 stop:3231 length:1860 start_codon:yes stop_codon:yes gene_type:complete
MSLFTQFFNYWRSFAKAYSTVASFRWLVIGVLVGTMSGLVAVAFFWLVEIGKFILQHNLAGLVYPEPAGEGIFHGPHGEFRPWLIPVFTTGTALLTGWLVNKFIPETVTGGTDGTDATINAFHNQGGVIKGRVALIRGACSVLTIASGGSAGREGPITQIGAGLGSWLANKFDFSAKERRLLLLSGAAGGLGAIFRAPLGGALTAVEVIYREDFEAEAILPSVMSSVVSYSIFTFFYGTEPIFGIPRFSFHDPRELIFYVLLAFVCAAVGWMYIRTFTIIKYNIFYPLREKLGIIWSMGIGGLAMGLIGILYPHTAQDGLIIGGVLSGGYGWLELAILGQIPALGMCYIIVGKTVATSVTIGSGMSGGMFAPALFVGGMSGGLVGKFGHHFFPDIVTQPGAYILVGMAAFFAGVASAPIGPLIMVTELTQGYGLLAPLMLASALCLVLCRKVSLYEHQVENKFESPAHAEDATINVLEQMHVSDFYNPGEVIVLEESTTLKALTDIIANSDQLYFPVRRSEDGWFVGMVSIHNVRNWMFEEDLHDLVVVRDLMSRPVYVRPDYDLYQALLRFVNTDYGQIPVVSETDTSEIIGLINRDDVFQAYAEAIAEVKGEADEVK